MVTSAKGGYEMGIAVGDGSQDMQAKVVAFGVVSGVVHYKPHWYSRKRSFLKVNVNPEDMARVNRPLLARFPTYRPFVGPGIGVSLEDITISDYPVGQRVEVTFRINSLVAAHYTAQPEVEWSLKPAPRPFGTVSA